MQQRIDLFVVAAIKTGRYTHEKKTRDIREVKRLQEVEKLKREGRYVDTATTTTATSKRSSAPARLTTPASSPDVPDNAELEKIIKDITDVHMQHTPHTPEFFAKLPQKEKEFLVSCALFPAGSVRDMVRCQCISWCLTSTQPFPYPMVNHHQPPLPNARLLKHNPVTSLSITCIASVNFKPCTPLMRPVEYSDCITRLA